ncbi:unnamed protein product, partial [Gongylonema pulchrum]|uniref:Clathrin_bdg domain-containing protein n=1 Tax=Gongylonema pulchrum TaxID=637853 RepID=A0A183EIJ1_9BILA
MENDLSGDSWTIDSEDENCYSSAASMARDLGDDTFLFGSSLDSDSGQLFCSDASIISSEHTSAASSDNSDSFPHDASMVSPKSTSMVNSDNSDSFLHDASIVSSKYTSMTNFEKSGSFLNDASIDSSERTSITNSDNSDNFLRDASIISSEHYSVSSSDNSKGWSGKNDSICPTSLNCDPESARLLGIPMSRDLDELAPVNSKPRLNLNSANSMSNSNILINLDQNCDPLLSNDPGSRPLFGNFVSGNPHGSIQPGIPIDCDQE